MSNKKQTYRKLLSPKFFRDNEYSEHSAQRFIYSLLLDDWLTQAAIEAFLEGSDISDERLKNIEDEKTMIASLHEPEKILDLMRKNLDVMNRPLLIDKALEYESEILPPAVDKLIRNTHDIYIENAIQLLSKSRENYCMLLKERFDEIRCPYVKSLVCLILGLRGDEEIIPWMIDKFYEMEKHYPDEDYDQGPLLALHELNSRFYL